MNEVSRVNSPKTDKNEYKILQKIGILSLRPLLLLYSHFPQTAIHPVRIGCTIGIMGAKSAPLTH